MNYSPKKKPITVTRDVMEQLYVKHDFDQKIAQAVELPIFDQAYSANNPLHPDTTFIRERKYRQDGVTIAVVIWYTHKDGSVTRSIRMLLVDDQPYGAAELPSF